MSALLEAIPDGWRDWPDPQKAALLVRLQQEVYLRRRAAWQPYPWQVPPAEVPTHGTWLMLGGRGTGKTDGCARYVDEHVNGPPCDPRIKGGHRVAIVAPTLGDAAESAVTGPSGLQAHNPLVQLKHTQGGAKVVWPNGSEGKLFGAYTPEDVERLRAGGNRCLVWLEEAAAMRKLSEALEHTGLGLRIGRRPHYVASTTPKPRKELRDLVAESTTLVTTGRTADATHLDPTVRDFLYRRHKGTRLERQELEGVLITDVDGALWSWNRLDTGRVRNAPTGLRIVVSVDPAVSNTAESDETGIVVVGYDPTTTHGYVLEDASGRYSPHEWARRAVDLHDLWAAEAIVAERNQGGDMVEGTVRAVDKHARYRSVTATRGKKLRAEPVSALYDQGRWHHVGAFPELEEQMTTWTPDDDDSPDRLDALVHGVTDLAIKAPRKGNV